MRALGWEVHGIEPDPVAAESAAHSTGAKIWPGSAETAQPPEGTFDAVVSLHSIEHVYDPRELVRRAAGFLRPGGFLYILTPNFESLGQTRFRQDWFALEIPRHLNLMTPKSLRSICESCGLLRVKSVRTLSRRALREREQVYTVRDTGDFNAPFEPRPGQSFGTKWFGFLEGLGNSFFKWGEELELIAHRR
jgi:SAM-dependent methyltransferase